MITNAVIAQSGGPSPVINSSLLGVVDGARDYPDRVGRIFGAWHGLEGILREELLDLTAQPDRELRLLRSTAGAGAIGTCRYKLDDKSDDDLLRIMAVFQAHDVGSLYYIGGNDSMETAARIASFARARSFELVVTGIPKTIDNDLGDQELRLIDHTPGFGSAARYWASIIQDIDEENRGMSTAECVTVLQAMGRNAGFIPAAARLGDPERRMPLQIYCAESSHSLDSLAENVNRCLVDRGRCVVVVSEGFDVGGVGEIRDAFGHVDYGAGRSTVAQAVVNHLNAVGLRARGYVTGQVPGVLQRSTAIYASMVDVEEAYQVGRSAVEIATPRAEAAGGEARHGEAWMATILRAEGSAERGYRARYDKVSLAEISGRTRRLPPEWITPDGVDVTDDFVRYARPLLGEGWPSISMEHGLQRFARLEPRFREKKLPAYQPMRHRAPAG